VVASRPRFLKILFLLSLAAVPLRADPDAAKAAYARGVGYEKNKDYAKALLEYKLALAEDPSLILARRQSGNCHYYLHEKEAALADYQSYLAAKPDDALVQSTAARLEAELVPVQAPLRSPYDSEAPLRLHDAFYAGVSLGEVMTDKADMQQLVPGSIVPDQYALLGTLRLGFLSSSGFSLDGAFNYGPYRNFTGSYSAYPYNFEDHYEFQETSFCLEPGFRVPLGRRMALGGGLALGYASQSFKYTSTLYRSQSFSGSNFSYTPEIKASLFFGRIGLDIDLGYHNSKSEAMKDSSGAPLIVTNLSTGAKSNWNMDNSGWMLRVGAVYYFNPPMPVAPKKRRAYGR
jgi:hypothetical protein